MSYSEGNKMQLNFCFNIINRNNSRHQMPPKIMKSEIKDDFFDDKINSNSVNNNEMKLVKKRLTFMEPDQNFSPDEYEIQEKIGSGSFGKIYSVKWGRNGKKYAMKICKFEIMSVPLCVKNTQ